MLACNCLNVTIESESGDFGQAPFDLLNLKDEEKDDVFFKQDIKLIDKSGKINKEHSGLVMSRYVGNWIVHRCLNCDVHTHAIHRDRDVTCILVPSNLLNSSSILSLQRSDFYSRIFKVLVVSPLKEDVAAEECTKLSPDIELALNGLKHRLVEVLHKEAATAEERIRSFTEQQHLALEKLRDKAQKEHKVLERIIVEKRYRSSDYTMPSPPSTRLPIDNVPVLTNPSSPNIPKSKLVTKMKSNPNRMAVRQMSTPVGYGKSIDSEGLFQLEEMEDYNNQISLTEYEDSDNDETRIETSHIARGKGQPVSIAKSLPVNIPAFMSVLRNRDTDDERDDDILLQEGEHPGDIAASIKALAKSVHGDTVFGDLPRPRFSTQI